MRRGFQKVVLSTLALCVFLTGVCSVSALVTSPTGTAPSVRSGREEKSTTMNVTATSPGVKGTQVELDVTSASPLSSTYFVNNSSRSALLKVYEDDVGNNADDEVVFYAAFFNGLYIDAASKTIIRENSGYIDSSTDATVELYHMFGLGAISGDNKNVLASNLYTYRYYIYER